MTADLSTDIVGFRACGRHGELGIIIELRHDEDGHPDVLVVRGGVTDLLVYHVPAARIRSLSRESRTVRLDIDLAEFAPQLGEDGTIRLYASS